MLTPTSGPRAPGRLMIVARTPSGRQDDCEGVDVKFSIEMSAPAGRRARRHRGQRPGRPACRFRTLGYTDHPAPSKKWLQSGGHVTFDPFAALCYLAR